MDFQSTFPPPQALSQGPVPAALPTVVHQTPQLTTAEALQAFEAFVTHHSEQQKALYNQMVVCIKEMFEEPSTVSSGAAAKKNRATLSRFSMATMNNLALYITSHQRFLSSLIGDVANGRIGKASRKVNASKKKETTTAPTQTSRVAKQGPQQEQQQMTIAAAPLAVPVKEEVQSVPMFDEHGELSSY